MLERDLRIAKSLPENQGEKQQDGFKIIESILALAEITDPPTETSIAIETNEESEFIFDHSLFTFYPERGGIIIMKKDGRRVDLNLRETGVLENLARNTGRVATFKNLRQIRYNLISDNMLKVTVADLRRKLGDERVRGQFRIIKSEFGVGFILLNPLASQQYNPSLIKEGTIQPDQDFIYRHSSGFEYNSGINSVTVDNNKKSLTYKLDLLLKLFIMNENRITTTDEIGRTLWPNKEGGDYDKHLINKYVGNLRRKIKDRKAEGEKNFTLIRTEHGRGYTLVEPGTSQLLALKQ